MLHGMFVPILILISVLKTKTNKGERKMQTKDVKLIKHLNKLGINTDDLGRCKIDVGVLKKLKPMPSGNGYKAVVVRDKNLMGFRVRVNTGGLRTFHYRFRPKGKTTDNNLHEKQHISIGTWYDVSNPKEKDLIGITPAFARKLAEEMKVKIQRKEDPWSIVKERKKGRSLLSVYEDWIMKRLPSANYKPKSVRDYKSRYELYIKCSGKGAAHKKLYRQSPAVFGMMKLPIKDLTKDDYIALHNAITKHKPYPANRVVEDLRLVEKYAVEIGLLSKRVVEFKKKELNLETGRLDREDPYTIYEMKRYRINALKLISEDRKTYLVPCLSLLATGLLGGRSKSMIFSIKWDQINLPKGTIKFIDTKNNKPITLDFDYRFKAILRIMKAHRETINHRDKRHVYVFPTSSKEFKTKHINDPRKTHTSIIGRAKLKYKCIHFLRHSWATNFYNATGDVMYVQEAGGWRDINSVKKYITVSDRIRKDKLAQVRNYTNKNSHVA